ncbi:hypothetical protein TeGR_g6261 [Tetraparma gracilis]|uniref:Uncharacterized protein n=1 Tax=Tetraparma gracilis TaxID=2962635 RepID=A0ABQ6N8S6_9STRA|nr:hypothetical protein TeGR_g6261 [Tetraparma gracilis]
MSKTHSPSAADAEASVRDAVGGARLAGLPLHLRNLCPEASADFGQNVDKYFKANCTYSADFLTGMNYDQAYKLVHLITDDRDGRIPPNPVAVKLYDFCIDSCFLLRDHLPNGHTQLALHEELQTLFQAHGPLIFGGGDGSPLHLDGKGTLGAMGILIAWDLPETEISGPNYTGSGYYAIYDLIKRKAEESGVTTDKWTCTAMPRGGGEAAALATKLLKESIAGEGSWTGKEGECTKVGGTIDKEGLLGGLGPPKEAAPDPAPEPISPSSSEEPSDAAQGQTATGKWTEEEHERFLEGQRHYGEDWEQLAAHVKTRTRVQVQTHARARVRSAPPSTAEPGIGPWSEEETERFLAGVRLYGEDWEQVATHVGTRTRTQVRHYNYRLPPAVKRKRDSEHTLEYYHEGRWRLGRITSVNPDGTYELEHIPDPTPPPARASGINKAQLRPLTSSYKGSNPSLAAAVAAVEELTTLSAPSPASARRSKAARLAPSASFAVGTAAEYFYDDGWYPGCILSENPDDTFDLSFEATKDYDAGWVHGIERRYLRLPLSASAKPSSKLSAKPSTRPSAKPSAKAAAKASAKASAKVSAPFAPPPREPSRDPPRTPPRASPRARAQPLPSSPFLVNSTVEYLFDNEWHPGRIVGRHPDGTFDLSYGVGKSRGKLDGVTSDQLRVTYTKPKPGNFPKRCKVCASCP